MLHVIARIKPSKDNNNNKSIKNAWKVSMSHTLSNKQYIHVYKSNKHILLKVCGYNYVCMRVLIYLYVCMCVCASWVLDICVRCTYDQWVSQHWPTGTTAASLRCLRGVEMSMKSSATWKREVNSSPSRTMYKWCTHFVPCVDHHWRLENNTYACFHVCMYAAQTLYAYI